jgi:FixJ family two-component response regulator
MGNDGARRIVVVVEDDPAVCSSLKFALEIEGFRVLTFPDAASVLQQQDPLGDVCYVIDYYLPNMNGLDLISALRKRRAGLPVVLMTTHPTPRMREIARREGIPIVEKPLLGNTLVESIRQVWGRGPEPRIQAAQ